MQVHAAHSHRWPFGPSNARRLQFDAQRTATSTRPCLGIWSTLPKRIRMEAHEASEEALFEAAIKRVAFYKRDQIHIGVTRPITVVACRGVRRRACGYRLVVACVVATSSRLSPTSPIRLAEFHACLHRVPSPLSARLSCKISPIIPHASAAASPTETQRSTLPTFRGELHLLSSSRHGRLFTLAIAAQCLEGRAAGGMPSKSGSSETHF